jgi:UDP-GlcNAc:undecaprenyl-phosphate GlcNAc-1-phosphate transferase
LKARLKPLKDRGNIIKFAFGYVKVTVPMLLIFNALYQPSDSGFVLVLSFAFIILLVVAWLFNKKLLSQTAKIALYLFTPFLVFRSDLALYSALSPLLLSIYNGLFLILLISVYLTMMLTRRANGFKSSTMDFLVIFVIILIANLPDTALKGHILGLVAVKTVILYYSYEVLVGELRNRTINFSISLVILIMGVKGVVTVL